MFAFLKSICYTVLKIGGIGMSKGSEMENKIYNFIRQKLENSEVPPTVREICEAVGLASPSSVFGYMRSLEKKGRICIDRNKKRSVTIPDLEPAMPSGQVPLVGRVTAGIPITAVEQLEGHIPFDADLCERKELFALRVRGDSMIDAAILDGDIVIVEKTPWCENGQIVVALVDDSATVKRFYKENGHFRLQPENEAYEPIIVPEVSILGKVIAVMRYM